MKAIDFGDHLPVMDFGEGFSNEKILLCARKAEDLGYDSRVNDHISFRTAGLMQQVHYLLLLQPLTR